MRAQRQTHKLTGDLRRDHMLSWIFKKFGRSAAPAKATAASRKDTEQASQQATQKTAQEASQKAAQKAAQKSSQKAQELAAAQAEWAPRLQAAQGDDSALLVLAQAAPVLDIKLAAISALQGEAALKQAEREFRNQDKRLHRAAKTRLEAAVAQREARAGAQALIDRATALDLEADLPVNMLVSLDRDWQALNHTMLEPAQSEAFNRLNEALNGKLRQRSELERQMQRWATEAHQALNDWQAAAEQAATSGQPGELSGAHTQALQALEARCPDASAAPSQDLLQQITRALLSTAQIEARLQCLASLSAPPSSAESEPTADGEAALSSDSSPASLPTSPPAASASQQWQALEAIADASFARLLTQRFEQWRQTQQRAQATADAPSDSEPKAAAARPKAARKPAQQMSDAKPEQAERFAALLAQAEAAHAEGLLSEMQALLQQIDTTLQGVKPASLSQNMVLRHHALLAERSRLRDWEQWGGARALDALVAEAESLAEATLAATAVAAEPAEPTEPIAGEMPDSAESASAPAAPAETAAPTKPAKLNLKAHREAIQDLRKRWKEVDRLSAGAGHALWPRFDAALQTANQPVAAQLAELKATREANLASRELLLDQLDGFAAADAGLSGEAAAGYWKECLRVLSNFQLAWRQLGPVEHTTPLSSREALLQRQRASLERIEAPLQQARGKAAAQREQLIQQAESLLQELQKSPQIRELTPRVRELQAEWQNQARSLPLARAIENDLWARFKAATDAVFAQRSAAFDARDEAIAASLAGYEALLARLSALSLANTDAEIRRTLAEVDRDWRQGGELPRASETALNARLQAAHQAALQILAGRSQLLWQAQCAALAAKLQLCREREQEAGEQGQAAGEPASDEQFKQRWAEAGALPASWERALEQRFAGSTSTEGLAASDIDQQLLQLEAALDLPCSAELMAARRQLKLKTMKDVLEGRGSAEQGPAQQTSMWLAVLSQRQVNAEQAQRLAALVAALPNAPAGTLAADNPKP